MAITTKPQLTVQGDCASLTQWVKNAYMNYHYILCYMAYAIWLILATFVYNVFLFSTNLLASLFKIYWRLLRSIHH